MSRINCHPEPCDRCRQRPARVYIGNAYVCRSCRDRSPAPDPREIAPEVLARLPEYLRDYSPEVADDMKRRGLPRSPQAVADAAAKLERILEDAGLDVQ